VSTKPVLGTTAMGRLFRISEFHLFDVLNAALQSVPKL
jgi:hypothetical protein